MFDFIDILKAVAAVLITNSHYVNIWPSPYLAIGGLLGDVMFFAASGFCLYNIRQKFHIWYLKRIFRIYPVLWVINLTAMFIGFYGRLKYMNIKRILKLFVYPTYYHFIASIMVLYIAFYIAVFLSRKFNFSLLRIMSGVFAIYIICYFTVFDRSYYHIDEVESHIVRFIFFEAMLLGAYMRKKADGKEFKFRYRKFVYCIITAVLTVLYFGSKVLFTAVQGISQLQIFNQIILFALLASIMYLLCMWENTKSKRLSEYKGGRAVKFVSGLTLEIYITQYLVYYLVPQLPFPVNLIVVTALILIFAKLANIIGNFLTKNLNKLTERQSIK